MADISHLAPLNELQALLIQNTPASDISVIATMTSLDRLHFGGTKIDDITPLASLVKLNSLILSNTEISDISPLAELIALRHLDLDGSRVADLSPLSAMTNLEALRLQDSPADLLKLVEQGSPWADEDGALITLGYEGTSATRNGGVLANFLEPKTGALNRTKAALASLRIERERLKASTPPKIAQVPIHDHVFLSYSHEDSSKTKLLRDALEADGITVWQDVDMAVGKRFRVEIDARIASAAAVLVLWSDTSVSSDYVQSEAERARQANKLRPALLASVTPLPPFDVFNAADLSTWSGDRGDLNYQRLLADLRKSLISDAPVGVAVDDHGSLNVEMQPVGAPFADTREGPKAEALRTQSLLVLMLAEEAQHANAHPRLEPRLRAYLKQLDHGTPLRGSLDGVFDSIVPLLKDDALDDGLKNMAARVESGHSALKPFFTKEGTGDDPDWPELPPTNGGEAAKVLGDAAEAVEAGPFGNALPSFLRESASIIEAARDEAAEGPDAEDRARKSGGRAVYLALGVLSSAAGVILQAAGNVSSIASYLATEAGLGMLSKLGAAWQTLMLLVGLK